MQARVPTPECDAAATDDGAPNLLRLPAVMARVHKSKSQIYSDIAAGKFPPSVRLGHRTAVWLEDEVEAWVRDRISSRSAAG